MTIKKREDRKKWMLKITAFLMLLAVVVIVPAGIKSAYAASVSVVSIDYEKSEITIQMAPADTVLLISDKNKKKWEPMPNEPDGQNRITIDISWISASKDYVLSLKGDSSDDPISVTIPKQESKFKVTYNMLSSNVSFTGVKAGRTVEWRKKEGLAWNTYNADEFPGQLASFCTNGASLYFRLAPVAGTSAADPGLRASKEVSLSVAKKIAAPKISVNDSSLTIALAKGMEYRYLQTENGNPVTNNDGSYVAWTEITKTDDVLLEDIASGAFYNAADSSYVPREVYLQFRTKATSSKQMSSNTSITIPVQQEPIVNDKEQVVLKYTSSTTFQIQVLYASSEDPYEYCILDEQTLNKGSSIEDVDPLDITWKTITSTSAISFDKDKDDIEEGCLVYVRKKALKALGDDEYKLASPPLMLTSASGISYPGDASVENGFVWLQTIAGVCNTGNANGQITFTMYSPTETTIKTLKFVDYNSHELFGEVEIKSSVAKNTNTSATEDQQYIITTTIKSTAAIDSHTKTRMLAYITFESNSAYESTTDKGIGLYIYPATKVDNPDDSSEKERIGKLFYGSSYTSDTDYVDYTESFSRVYMSNKVYSSNGDGTVSSRAQEDARSFKFVLELGTIYKKTLTGTPDLDDEVYSASAGNRVEISSIKYDSVILNPNCYSVQYVKDSSTAGKDIVRALITVNADEIEKIPTIDERNKAVPMIIYLNNGEILNNQITLNLVNTATVNDAPISWSLTAGTLETVKTVTKTDGANNTITTEEKVYDYIINLTLFSPEYSVGVNDVTWGDVSVYDKATVSGGKVEIYLSNEKINQISVNASTTKPLVISLSNGYTISSGCTMTILKGTK